MNCSKVSVPFLDINISLKNGYLLTDVYVKPTDSHAFLHYNSCHPRHCIENIPYSQFIRLRRVCSNVDIFDERAEEMTFHFLNRGYDKNKLEKTKLKVRGMVRDELLAYKPKATCDRPPFVITHNPCNPPLNDWFRELQTSVVAPSDRMSKVLPQPPIIVRRNCKSLRNKLMPSKLPVARNLNPGCIKCSRGCLLCRLNLVEGIYFSSQTTGETFTIRDSLSCQTRNVIYLLFCAKGCPNSQYIGRTINGMRIRFATHRCHIEDHKGTHVCDHFNQPDHSARDLRCMAIE